MLWSCRYDIVVQLEYFNIKRAERTPNVLPKVTGVEGSMHYVWSHLPPFNIHLAHWAHMIDVTHLIVNTKVASSPHKRSFVESPTSIS